MNGTKGFLLILLLLSFFGCASTPERHIVISPDSRAEPIPVIPNQLLDKRIRFLTRLLEQEKITVKDRKIASNLLEAYKSVKKASRSSLKKEEYRRTLNSFFHYLNLVDEHYFDKERAGTRDYSEAIKLFADERDKIIDTYISGDFKGVIKKCLKLKTEFGPDALIPEIALLFALSLAEEGMLEQAINIGEGVIHTIDTMPDLVILRARMAELQLRSGEREKARLVYEKLTDSLDEQFVILRSLEKKISETQVTGPGLKKTTEQKQKGLKESYPIRRTEEEFLQHVEDLVQAHRFGEAMDLLVTKRDRLSQERRLKRWSRQSVA